MFITQISVYLENNKGTLRELTKLLAVKDIDLLALSIADTTQFGLVRIIIREADVETALSTLKENGFVAKKNHVFCIAVPNQPAGLDSVLAVIEENNISIEYMYSLNYIIGSKALLVMRLSAEGKDKEQIGVMLEDSSIVTITQDEINKL